MSALSQGWRYAGSSTGVEIISSSPKHPENIAGNMITSINTALRMPYGHMNLDLRLSIIRLKYWAPSVGGFMC